LNEELEDDTEREKQWLKKEFGENNEFFIALLEKLKKKGIFKNSMKCIWQRWKG
jgi:hypothetical protein